MSDYSHGDKELIFINTPLENLKTILSEADASANVQPSQLATKTITKQELRNIILQLRQDPSNERILDELTNKTQDIGTRGDVKASSLVSNIHIVKLQHLLHNKA